jgi:hypothetical protein
MHFPAYAAEIFTLKLVRPFKRAQWQNQVAPGLGKLEFKINTACFDNRCICAGTNVQQLLELLFWKELRIIQNAQ